MNKFNIESARFVSIIIGICFIFVMVIWNAFDYLPQDAVDDRLTSLIKEENTQQENTQKEALEDNAVNEESEDEISDDDIDEPVTKVTAKPEPTSIQPLEVIPDEELNSGNTVSTDSQDKESPEEKLLVKARTLKADKQYTAAIAEYEKLIQNYKYCAIIS